MGLVSALPLMNYVFLGKTLTSQIVDSLSIVNHNTYLASLLDCGDYHITLFNSVHKMFLNSSCIYVRLCARHQGRQINKILIQGVDSLHQKLQTLMLTEARAIL